MNDADKIIKGLRQEIQKAREDISLIMKVNVDLRKELTMLEKLNEFNMQDLWHIADQRDWYHEEYAKLKQNNVE
jgi:hypothetical protein